MVSKGWAFSLCGNFKDFREAEVGWEGSYPKPRPLPWTSLSSDLGVSQESLRTKGSGSQDRAFIPKLECGMWEGPVSTSCEGGRSSPSFILTEWAGGRVTPLVQTA